MPECTPGPSLFEFLRNRSRDVCSLIDHSGTQIAEARKVRCRVYSFEVAILQIF